MAIIDKYPQNNSEAPFEEIDRYGVISEYIEDPEILLSYEAKDSNFAFNVRKVTPSDLDAIVQLELEAFSDVYTQPETEDIDRIKTKFDDRINKLDEWFYVLEDEDLNVVGMLIGCPSSIEPEELSSFDMTGQNTVNEIYDEDGDDLYIINLAVSKSARSLKGSYALLGAMIRDGFYSDKRGVIFESRVPNYQKWATDPDNPNQDRSIENYVAQTRQIGGKERPLDPLLALYNSMGAEIVKPVYEAWEDDLSSKQFGVLSRRLNPLYSLTQLPDNAKEMISSDIERLCESPSTVKALLEGELDLLELSEEPLEEKAPRLSKIKKALGITGIAGLAYSLQSHGISSTIEEVHENAGWVPVPYIASQVGYWASAAVMGIRTGVKARNPFKFADYIRNSGEDLMADPIFKGAFAVNAISAVSAAGVVGAGVLTGLPQESWSLATLPAIDLYSTVSLRYLLYDYLSDE